MSSTKKTPKKVPEIPTDFMGNELAIGDMVAFNPPRVKGLAIGHIVGFAPQSARIEYAAYYSKDTTVTCSRAYTDIIKVPGDYQSAYLLIHGKLTTKNTLR